MAGDARVGGEGGEVVLLALLDKPGGVLVDVLAEAAMAAPLQRPIFGFVTKIQPLARLN